MVQHVVLTQLKYALPIIQQPWSGYDQFKASCDGVSTQDTLYYWRAHRTHNGPVFYAQRHHSMEDAAVVKF